MTTARWVLLVSLVFGLSGPGYASEVEVQYQDQDQSQGQEQSQVQGQEQVAAGEQNVNVPRQHRRVPDVTIQTAPGQSGFGVSFPGGSIGGVKTDIGERAKAYLDICGEDCDRSYAVAQVKKSLDSCYFAGPVGQFLGYIPWVDLENDGGPFCF